MGKNTDPPIPSDAVARSRSAGSPPLFYGCLLSLRHRIFPER